MPRKKEETTAANVNTEPSVGKTEVPEEIKETTENEPVVSETTDSENVNPQVYLTVTAEGKQYVEQGIVIRYGEKVVAPDVYSDELIGRIRAGFVKEVE